MEKVLSIIIPSYNMEQYLPRCLDSLLVKDGQLLQSLDIIIVNDGSRDRTSEIAHDFAQRYPKSFRVIDKPNGNYGSCINAALSVVMGRFVRILDADDTYDTAAFGEYLRRLATVPDDVEAVVSDFVEVDENDVPHVLREYPFSDGQMLTPDDLCADDIVPAMHAFCYRTDLLQRISYRQTEGISYTDTEWFYSPMASARKCMYLKHPVYRYLVGRVGQTMQASVFAKNHAMLEKIAAGMFAYYDRHAFDEGVSRPYLERQLRRVTALIATTHVFALPQMTFSSYVQGLERLLREYPFLEDVLSQATIFRGTGHPFHYLKILVRCPQARWFVLPMIRAYSRARIKRIR